MQNRTNKSTAAGKIIIIISPEGWRCLYSGVLLGLMLCIILALGTYDLYKWLPAIY